MKTGTLLSAIFIAAVSGSLMPAAASASNLRLAVGDLDQTTADGRAALARRIERAAWQACLYTDAGTLRSPERQAACSRDVSEQAVIEIAAMRPRQILAKR